MKTFLTALTLSMVFGMLISTAANSKSYKRSQFNKEQQAKIFKQALDACRKQYGDRLHHVQVDYAKGKTICYIY